ncbi:hypothetical protein BOTCAL_0110g00260 [Botryotinia calthae]|uniref:Uncharacterized protein n=1 Tax=Botryotinia calthae TaxID=38488 RepID=A0A4Y8D5H5_9HELO|nr:hypothetical protein BOTCAL_0110g00260 [Botryotinia calthae]
MAEYEFKGTDTQWGIKISKHNPPWSVCTDAAEAIQIHDFGVSDQSRREARRDGMEWKSWSEMKEDGHGHGCILLPVSAMRGAMHAANAVHEMGCTYESPELKPSE